VSREAPVSQDPRVNEELQGLLDRLEQTVQPVRGESPAIQAQRVELAQQARLVRVQLAQQDPRGAWATLAQLAHKGSRVIRDHTELRGILGRLVPLVLREIRAQGRPEQTDRPDPRE